MCGISLWAHGAMATRRLRIKTFLAKKSPERQKKQITASQTYKRKWRRLWVSPFFAKESVESPRKQLAASQGYHKELATESTPSGSISSKIFWIL
jgi:hypothetical protein